MAKYFLFAWFLVPFFTMPPLRADPVQVLFPFILTGRIVDYNNAAFGSESGMTICAYAADGTLLAKNSIFSPNALSAWNFRLEIPIASAPCAGYANAGDAMSVTISDSDGNVYAGFLSAPDSVVGTPGSHAVVRIMLSSDANGNGISDIYEETKEYEMFLRDIVPPYDPDDDYDRDGVSNRQEYLAGTDPFDGSDYFKILKSAQQKSIAGYGDFLAISFEAYPGRTYTVRFTDSIAPGSENWGRDVFYLKPELGSRTERVANAMEEWSVRTIYLLKKGNVGFYKLELEQ